MTTPRAGRLVAALATVLALLGSSAAPVAAAVRARAPIEVRVVIISTWETVRNGQDLGGELHAWRTQWPLRVELPFPLGVGPLFYDPRRHVLAILTGMATARASASIMALGTDRRFDLRHAYWILAGTAGVDPKVASAGSAAWARWVVDGDLAQELDSRDMPADWPTGVVPYGRVAPYQAPPPVASGDDPSVVYALNPGLADWAYARTRDIALPDDAALARLRAPYAGAALRAPFVFEGESLASTRTWYGGRLNDWAERWVSYWTAGHGVFAMSDEEDAGVMQALSFLAQDGRVKLDRVLILRAASDYTVGPPGVTAAAFLAKEAAAGFPAEHQALTALYAVASPVARALADDWSDTRDTAPGGTAERSAR